MNDDSWARPGRVLAVLTGLGAVCLASPIVAQTRVVPLNNGDVSVDMDGCSVLLNERGDIEAEGRVRRDRDEPELGRTRVGNDQVSSMRVDCR